MTTPSGEVVKAVPIGFHGRFRSNAICIEEGGEKLVSVTRDGRKILMPLDQLTPATRVQVAPRTHLMPFFDEHPPFTTFSQPLAPGVNGITEADEAATSKATALRNYAEKVQQYSRGEETYGVVQMYEQAALDAGATLHEVGQAYERGMGVRFDFGEPLKGVVPKSVSGIDETNTLKFYTGPVNARPIAEKLREVGYEVTVGTENVYVRQGGGSTYDAESEVFSRLLARFGTKFGLGEPVGRAGLRGIDETNTLRLYGSCVKKCRRHAPQSLGPCIDQCQEKGGAFSGIDKPYVHPRATAKLQPGDYANTVMAGGHLKTVEVVEVSPNGMLSVVGVHNGERHVVDPRTTYKMPHTPGSLRGTDDYHAHSASMWATNAVEEAELGAGDALNKGQCNRALESLVRAERKTTMASTNATQTGNERLKAKARESNALVNAMWREFQVKCIRRNPGDHPGSVLPFGGLGGVGSLHERIAAVLGWSVKDTQGFSLSMLREMVRGKDPQLAREIGELVQSGRHIFQGLGEVRYTLPDVE